MSAQEFTDDRVESQKKLGDATRIQEEWINFCTNSLFKSDNPGNRFILRFIRHPAATISLFFNLNLPQFVPMLTRSVVSIFSFLHDAVDKSHYPSKVPIRNIDKH